MALFGRNTARQRLRRAAEQSLQIPSFTTPAVDCTPWVTGGLWPAELSTVTPQTAPLVKYLKADLARIVTSANEELKNIRCAGLVDSQRRAHEARVITDARAFAIQRVESSVRHLRDMTTKSPVLQQPPNGHADAVATARFKLAPPQPDIPDTPEALTSTTDFESAELSLGRQPESAIDAPPRDSAPAPLEESGEVEADRPSLDTATSDRFDSDETAEIATPAALAYSEAAEPAAADTETFTTSTDSDETTEFAAPSPQDFDQAAEPAAAETQERYTAAPTDSGETTECAPPSSLNFDDAPAPAAREVQRYSAPPDSDETTEFATPTSSDYAETAEPTAPDALIHTTPTDPEETTECAPPSSLEFDDAPTPAAREVQRYSAPPDSDETAEIEVPHFPRPADTLEAPSRDMARDVAADPPSPLAPEDTQALDDIANLMQQFSATLSSPPEPPQPAGPELRSSTFDPPTSPIDLESLDDDPRSARHALPPPPSETPVERLQRLVLFVARQEPGLHWAVGTRTHGSTLLVTDFAHGWIPPGIRLPADVGLLEPGWRYGTVDALLGQTEVSASYAPGDPLGWSADDDITAISPQPRALPAVDDLGWVLSDATHWRDGLPRMVSTLAKAAARGMGVAGSELNVLRAYLDTARHQLFAQYPALDAGLLLNFQLLAATEGLAGNDWLSANYHLAWFLKLSSPDAPPAELPPQPHL